MNDKTLLIAIVTLLGLGFVGVLFIAVPWLRHGFSDWKTLLIDDGIILAAIIMFVYGFYMNTKM